MKLQFRFSISNLLSTYNGNKLAGHNKSNKEEDETAFGLSTKIPKGISVPMDCKSHKISQH